MEDRLECVSPAPARLRFESVLKAERLADVPSRFRDPSFFDEVPLYSRYGQVQFLKEYGDVDRLLLDFSLDYLAQIVAAGTTNKGKRFVAITVVRDDYQQFIVPHVFICNGNLKQRLKPLQLTPPSSALGKYFQGLLRQGRWWADYRVLDDQSTVPEAVRVFIGYRSPPDKVARLEENTKNGSVTVSRK